MISQFIPSILLLYIYNATIKAPMGTVGQWPYIYNYICNIIYTSIIIYIYTHLCVYIHVIPDYWSDYITTYTSPLCSNDITNIPRVCLEQLDDVKWPPFMVGQWDGLFVLPLYHYIPIVSYYNISVLLPLYCQYYHYTTMISLIYIYIIILSSACCIYMTNITTNHMPIICQVHIYQSYTSYINVVTQL